jgi:hypothetical protein
MSSYGQMIQELAMEKVLRQQQEKQMICVCCVCGEARDDIAANGAWYSLKAHLSRYGIQEQDLLFSHTFCPYCFMHYSEQLGLVTQRAARILKSGPGGQIDQDEHLNATV